MATTAVDKRDVVIVTGFGPFGEHAVNASWEVVKLLTSTSLEKDLNVRLVIEELPVDYEVVKARVPALWQLHRPLLVCHVGVSAHASGLTVECRAFNAGYERRDVHDRLPAGNQCCAGAPDVIDCSLDVRAACRRVDDLRIAGLTGQTSTFAGRYLCEFTYYASLSVDPGRTVFVHVPPLGKGLTAAQMAEGLAKIVDELVKQVNCKIKKV